MYYWYTQYMSHTCYVCDITMSASQTVDHVHIAVYARDLAVRTTAVVSARS